MTKELTNKPLAENLIEEANKQWWKKNQEDLKRCLIIGKILEQVETGEVRFEEDSHIQTVKDFIRESDMPYSTGRHYLNIWKKFGEVLMSYDLKIATRRLVKLLSAVKDDAPKEDKKELIEKTKDLSGSDFKKELQVIKGKPDPDNCNCNNLKVFAYCSKHRKWHKIPDKRADVNQGNIKIKNV